LAGTRRPSSSRTGILSVTGRQRRERHGGFRRRPDSGAEADSQGRSAVGFRRHCRRRRAAQTPVRMPIRRSRNSGAMATERVRAGVQHICHGICGIQPSSRLPMTPEGFGMAISLEHAIPHPAAIDPLPSVEAEVHAAGHLVGRWSSVPSRELRRIRQILLRGGRHMGAASTIDLPESARELLEHVTAELQRRGQFGSQSRPAHCGPGSAHTRDWQKGALRHGRSI
jgi:hypothetical protein